MEISGRLTRNATVRELATNKSVVNFTLAQDTSYTSKDRGRVKRTNFFEVGYWGGTNVARLLTKGTAVNLVGTLSVDSYTTKEGVFKPVLRFTPDFSGIRILALGKSETGAEPAEDHFKSAENKGNSHQKADMATTPKGAEDDDLPF